MWTDIHVICVVDLHSERCKSTTTEKDTHLARLRKSVEDGCIDGDRNRLFDDVRAESTMDSRSLWIHGTERMCREREKFGEVGCAETQSVCIVDGSVCEGFSYRLR